MTADSCPVTGREPLYGPEFTAEPNRVYERLRRHGAVAPVEIAPGVPASLVISYEAALDVLRDSETFPKDASEWQKDVPADCPVLPIMMYRPNLNMTDGPLHARLRDAVNDSLARVDLTELRAFVEDAADSLIAKFGPAGKADLRAEFAQIIPLMVFNKIFGCPPELGAQISKGMSGIIDNVDAENANGIMAKAVMELLALKRARPGEDVVSWLMEHPQKLTDEELMHQIVMLLGGGTEPEQNLILDTMLLLLTDDRFADDLSGGSLPVDDAMEAVLWTNPPIANFGITYPRADLDFAGARLPANQPVVVSFAAANTDPSMASARRAGNRAHLAWSAGAHHCPAQGQARLIASVAIEKLMDRLPGIELAVPADHLEWRPGFVHRALTSMPVVFPPMASRSSAPAEAPMPTAPTPPTPPARGPVPGTGTRTPNRLWQAIRRWWAGGID